MPWKFIKFLMDICWLTISYWVTSFSFPPPAYFLMSLIARSYICCVPLLCS